MRTLSLKIGWSLALTVVSASGATPARNATIDRLVKAVEAGIAANGTGWNAYLGTETCLACHSGYSDFRSTLHATGLKSAADDRHTMKTKDGIIADYDRNGIDDFRQGLDFNQISSAFNQFKPNAPILGFGAEGYTIRIGQVVYPVAMVHGGSGRYKQRFLVRLPVFDTASGKSAGVYYSPIQYNEADNSWVQYETKYFYKADNTPLMTGPVSAKEAATAKSFVKGCAGCHATTLSSLGKNENGEYVATTPTPVYVQPGSVHYLDISGNGQLEMYNVGCERCHGPGARHVIATWDPGRIVNPAKDFTAKQQNFQCGTCHVRGASLPGGTHEYPLDENTGEHYLSYAPGEDLFTKYLAEKPGLWPDGKTSRQHHQQVQDLMKSSKWEYPYHKVTCTDCHDPHKPNKAQIRERLTVDGAGGRKLTLAVNVNDNSLCLGCHAGFGPFQQLKREQIADLAANRESIGRVVSEHTKHPYNPTGQFGVSRCTTCHMAQMAASGAPYDMHSHTFEVVPPERTLMYQAQGGMPNSCATCHRQTASMIGAPADTAVANWTEPSDRQVAEWLMKYYGPEGAWWRTKAEAQK